MPGAGDQRGHEKPLRQLQLRQHPSQEQNLKPLCWVPLFLLLREMQGMIQGWIPFPFFSAIVLFKNQLSPQWFWFFRKIRIPGLRMEMEVTPRNDPEENHPVGSLSGNPRVRSFVPCGAPGSFRLRLLLGNEPLGFRRPCIPGATLRQFLYLVLGREPNQLASSW